jgi:peroxiredoxin
MNQPNPSWMRVVLWAAAIYNLAWGAWVILRPHDLFVWTGIAPPTYPAIWQCVGMIVGVYGIGYAIAATNPLRHWPIVLVGLLGKIFGPIGMAYNLFGLPADAPGKFPPGWAWTILTNDLIWWVPFAAILYQAFKAWNQPRTAVGESAEHANSRFRSQHGNTISELSATSPVLVVFLRHRGCTFCREALQDLQKQRSKLEASGTKIVLVHMSDNDASEDYFASYGMGDVDRISDPNCELYRAYELRRGSFKQLLGPAVWWRGFLAAIVHRHGVGKLDGDGFQMPGTFLIRDNKIVKAYRHETAASRPDYCELAAG